MIQRIQSLYLLITLLLLLIPTSLGYGISSFLPQNEMTTPLIFSQSLTFLVPFINIPLIIIAILLFKKQKIQTRLVQIALIILILGIIGFYLYYFLGTTYQDPLSENWFKSIPVIISIPFLLLANKAIKKDLNLLRSIDRIR